MQSFDLSDDSGRHTIVNELKKAALAGQLTVWVGAGISYSAPASLPLALQIIQSVCEAIASELSLPLDALLTQYGETMRLEPFLRLVEVVCSFQDIEKLLDVFRRGKPNQNHLALAAALATHPGCSIINLNFDYLIEEALFEFFGILTRVIIPAGQHEASVVSAGEDRAVGSVTRRELVDAIIKPHGTLIKSNGTRGIVATVQELGVGLSPALRARIINAVNDRVLLVTGYSDDDLDLFPLLQSSHPRAVYWNTLSQDLPSKVKQWLLQLDKSISITHLWNRCEYLFSDFPNDNHMSLPGSTNWDFQEFIEKWVKELNSVAKLATIAAWLAQDQLRVQRAKELYLLALKQEECKKDLSLCRFIRYRYAELLRHQMEDKTNALKQYALVLWHALRWPSDFPLMIVTIRSLASSLRSISHRAGKLSALIYSIIAVVLLLSARTFIKIIPIHQWNSSRFHRDKGGTWLFWEFGMIFIGVAQKISWPKLIKVAILNSALGMFERSQRSVDIYEKSAAIFGQARTIGMLARDENKYDLMSKAVSLLNQAKELFVLLDDVTGLQNSDQLRKAFDVRGPDPWLGS